MAVTLPVNSRDEEVDMAPMIDMVFLLLVFFMVSSHLQSDSYIELAIPEASAGKVPEDRSGRTIVSVKENGKIFLGAEEVEEEVLEEVLKIRNEDSLTASNGNTALKLLIRGDENTEFGEVKKVMRMGAEAGIIDIIFATEHGGN